MNRWEDVFTSKQKRELIDMGISFLRKLVNDPNTKDLIRDVHLGFCEKGTSIESHLYLTKNGLLSRGFTGGSGQPEKPRGELVEQYGLNPIDLFNLLEKIRA